jgi:MoaA/NifB/PqqE/SkfB family radical SAM enzyme
MDGETMGVEDKVDGRDFTSNTHKLTRHLDKLANIQQGKPSAPVMIHMSLTNRCNLTCSYCCYGNRDLSDELTFDRAISAIDQFSALGTKGLEITGGGDPSMYRKLDDVVSHAYNKGMDVAIITNGIKLPFFNSYDKLQWMRVSLHGLNFDNGFEKKMGDTVEKARRINPMIDISSVYIWTEGSEKTLEKVVDFTDRYQIPTRLTPDLTLGNENIKMMMPYVGGRLKHFKLEDRAKYLFLSDFNVKTTREHNNCYMHLVKPFVYTDGNVYDCPSLALSPDNKLNVNEKFKVCDVEGITEYYSNPSKARDLDCNFCKYAAQNEYVHSLKQEVKHKNFA